MNKAKGMGAGLFSKLKSGLNEAVDYASEYAENKGWDQTLRQNVGINLPRSGPKHTQDPFLSNNLSFILCHNLICHRVILSNIFEVLI